MKSITPAYVAGLVDGEGCITIEVARKRFFYPRLYMGMSAKALPILELIHKEYGGTLRQHRAETLRWSAAWMLSIVGVPVIPLLEAIQPHLILKAEQCSIALNLAMLTRDRQAFEKGSIWDEGFMALADSLKQQIHQLNRKGPA